MTSPFDPAFSLTPLHIELFVACGYKIFADDIMRPWLWREDEQRMACFGDVPLNKPRYLSPAEFCTAYPHAMVAVPAADLLPLPVEPRPSDLPPYRRGVRDVLAYLQRTGVEGTSAEQALREAGSLEQARALRDEHDRSWGRLSRLLEVVPDGHIDEPAFTQWLDGVKREAAAVVAATEAAAAREAVEKQRTADREARPDTGTGWKRR